jgi:hypothetical protein
MTAPFLVRRLGSSGLATPSNSVQALSDSVAIVLISRVFFKNIGSLIMHIFGLLD